MEVQSAVQGVIPQVTPEAVGISSETLLKLLQELQKIDTLHSIMILRHGQQCLAGWWKPYRPEYPHSLFSLSKSFTSMAIGFACSERRLDLDDRMISFFPEYDTVVRDPRMRQMTLRHLLTMNTGHAVCAYGVMHRDPDQNWVRGFLASQLTYEPGTFFAYNSAATFMLAAVIRQVTGCNVREYLMPRLFDPLEIRPGRWESSPDGINDGGWGLYLKTEDLARVGQCILQRGEWNHQQIIPADYLAEATRKQVSNDRNDQPDWRQGYGYQFWISRHGFRGDGASGQYIVVLPRHDMVVATTASVSNMQQVLELFWEILLPGLKDSPLPENPEKAAELVRLLGELEIPHPAPGLSPQGLKGAVWHFEPNEAGITEVKISFPDDSCRLEFSSGHGREIVTAGFSKAVYSVPVQLNDALPRPVMAEARRRDAGHVDVFLYSLDGSFRDTFHLNFSGEGEPLSGECSYSTFRPGFLPQLVQSR